MYNENNILHKVTHWILEIWPILSALFLTFVMAVKLLLADRAKNKREIREVRELALWLKSNTVTHPELQACRDDVREVDDKNLNIIFGELKTIKEDVKQLIHEVASK